MTNEDARTVGELCQSDGFEGFDCGFVPVTGTALEAIEGLEEEKVGIFGSDGASCGRGTDIFFAGWKEALTEGLNEISTFGYPFHLGANAEK